MNKANYTGNYKKYKRRLRRYGIGFDIEDFGRGKTELEIDLAVRALIGGLVK